MFGIELPLECPDDHLLSSVREHSAHLANVMNGFDFLQCECKNYFHTDPGVMAAPHDQSILSCFVVCVCVCVFVCVCFLK